MKKQLATLAAAALAAAPLQAELVSRGESTGAGARALSLGQAFTGVADDYSALYYNAAGLTQLRHSELGINLGYRMRANDATPADGTAGRRAVETTRVNAAALVLTQGCGWALGMGYYTPTAYDDPLQYFARGREYAYEAFGNMDHYRLAFAFAPSKRVSVGLAASALSGVEQLEIRDGARVRYLEEYAGFNLEPSFLVTLSKGVTLGASVVAVERLLLRDTWQEEGRPSVETLYDIRHPFQTRLGLGIQAGLTQVSLDWHASYWSTYGYREEGAPFFQNDGGYPNRHVLALGLEHHLTRRGPVLRAGLALEGDDTRSFEQLWLERPKSLHLGFGLPASRHLLLDAGYQLRSGTFQQKSTVDGPVDLTVAETGHQLMASLRLRW